MVKNQGTNSVDQEIWEVVGNGKPTGSTLKETIVVSDTMSISVSRIRLRILSCSRVREMRREPEVPEEKVLLVECLDGLARITSKELAPLHSVESGIFRVLVLQDQEWLQIWIKVLSCTSSG